MNTLLQSSKNPENLSMTVQGVLVAIAPIIIGIMQMFDIEISETLFFEVVQAITALASAIVITYGALRKAWEAIKN